MELNRELEHHRHSRWATIARLLAPYVAVLVFWVGMNSGWLALIAYHSQILFWNRRRASFGALRFRPSRLAWLTLLSAPTGPLLYLLLPMITRTDLSAWLASYGLHGGSLILMVPYYGLLHPVLEQVHWSPLRRRTPWAHVLFAGYHVLVLHTLLPVPWLAACFLVLLVASRGWQWLEARSGGLAIPTLSHVLADLGLVLVALLAAFSAG